MRRSGRGRGRGRGGEVYRRQTVGREWEEEEGGEGK